MSTYRYYRGLFGERIPVREDTIATTPRIHSEACRFPFAELAGTFGAQRDRFASLVSRVLTFDEAMRSRRVRSSLGR